MPADAPVDALIYCQGAFATANGKTAHGLVRMTRRYRVRAVVDSTLAGRDAGEVLDGVRREVPIVASIQEGLDRARSAGQPATHLVVGLAPDGGRLTDEDRRQMGTALELGLSIHSGLHDFLSEDGRLAALAARNRLEIIDVRRPPDRSKLHFFSGKIEEVTSFKVALLGTDSAVGKRTTAWTLTDALNLAGTRTELVGTGQTAWMQGARYGVIMDSLVNDFVSGEIEHAVWSAWREARPEVIVIEGQGSLMNPAYPGGFEIMAAARPDVIILQHAPARKDYDGFPGYPIHPLPVQIQAVELISGKPVVAVTINHEGLTPEGVTAAAREITDATGLAAVDVLTEGPRRLADLVTARLAGRRTDR